MHKIELDTVLAKRTIEESFGTPTDKDAFLTYRHYRDCEVFMTPELELDVAIAPKGGVTFCVLAEPDSKVLHVSIAECNTNDLFNKEIARRVSHGRLITTGNYITIDWDREITIADNLLANWDSFNIMRSKDYLILTSKPRYLDK